MIARNRVRCSRIHHNIWIFGQLRDDTEAYHDVLNQAAEPKVPPVAAHRPQSLPDPAGVDLLPGRSAGQLIDPAGCVVGDDARVPAGEILSELYRRMVIGRRFDAQATALTKQGRLAVYPSSHGQDACQIGAVLALRDEDWLFPTYRDSVAVVMRGVDPVEAMGLLAGRWHCGYDPYAHRVAPQCTPLATNAPHAVGLAHAARLKGEETVALALIGDGATSEGDLHEALNFAAIWQAPVVFLVQNNGYAISVPLAKQTAAPSLAHKAVGYGMRGVLIDGNDAAMVYTTVHDAVERARGGGGPTLIEALTYRIEAHTNADDAARYRDNDEVTAWLARDPLNRLEAHLRATGLLDDAGAERLRAEAEDFATEFRERMNVDIAIDPAEMFAHVYATPTSQLSEQRDELLDEPRDADA